LGRLAFALAALSRLAWQLPDSQALDPPRLPSAFSDHYVDSISAHQTPETECSASP